MSINLKKVDLGKIKYYVYSSDNKDSISKEFNKEIIDSNVIPGALPAFLAVEEGKTKITYHVTDEKPLEEFLQEYIGKEELSNIIRSLINLFKLVKKKNIHTKDYVLDKDYVFIDPSSKEIYLIYLPLEEEKEEISIREFIKDIVGIVNYDLNDDLNFFVNVHNYLNDKDFTLEGLNILLDIESTNYSAPKEIDYSIEKQTNDIVTGFGQSGSTIFNNVEGTTFIDDDDDGGTTVIGLEDDYSLVASIKRISSGETVEIYKDNFKIGRDRNSCDFVVDNKLVGRLHAIIIKKYGEYYILDNSSRNGTFVNGEKIKTMTEYGIKDGDEIRLTNENFIFKLY